MYNKKWFSFIEIIITVSIIILLATIWFTANQNYKDSVNNTKSISNIETITNALELYLQDKKDLPIPKWNNNYFHEDSWYVHSSSGAFWVHWFITENTIPKKYLNVLPLDPRTKQYYAYWKTFNSLEFELSWVNWKNWEPEAFVKWNYSAEVWPYNLIREYNWPDFIYNKSLSNFPYNPDKRIITWRINDYNGTVTINNTITNQEDILNHILVEWDKIKVNIWWFVEIYFSDWSITSLWDTVSDTELVLEKMILKKENNLITNIKLALTSWTIWTKATSLDDESEFNIYTTDATAAVRWTIFWVSKVLWESNTNFTLIEWNIEVTPITEEKIPIEEKKVSLEVKKWWEIVLININSLSNTTTEINTFDILSRIPDVIKDNILNNYWKITNTIQPELSSYKKDENWEIEIWFRLSKPFKYADFFKIVTSQWSQYYLLNNWKFQSIQGIEDFLIIDWNKLFTRELHENIISWNQIYFRDIINETNSIKVYFWEIKKLEIKLSKWKEIKIINWDYSISKQNEFIVQNNIITEECTFLVWPENNKECAKNTSWAPELELIAYAPYNTPWDISLYKRDWGVYWIDTWWIIWNTSPLPQNCEINNSFCHLEVDNWWIFIDNDLNYDFLKYTWLELNQEENFVIEMNLKFPIRDPGTTRYLFQIGNYKLYLSTYWIFLKNQLSKNINISNKYDWNYHTIIAKKVWINYRLFFDWEELIELNDIISIWETPYELFIWTNNNNLKGLDNIINYIKIYK